MRNAIGPAQHGHGAGFGAAHRTLFRGNEIVVAGEMQPAVDEVEREFGGEGGRGEAEAQEEKEGEQTQGMGHGEAPCFARRGAGRKAIRFRARQGEFPA